MNPAYTLLGEIRDAGILIIADHASNHVPEDVNLGISKSLLNQHIAIDIGVFEVAELMVKKSSCAAILGANSRLVVDLNRYPNEQSVIPSISDGIGISGNALSDDEKERRLSQYYYPYHDKIEAIIHSKKVKFILSLHSFTPILQSNPNEKRPWEIGVLYNEDDRAARLAIPMLQDRGFVVGDQLPYSGKLLNATMNRHAEGNKIPYLGIEMRQDLVRDAAGQARFAEILIEICQIITEKLGATA
jgi:predicted N-formylglutamate amidohydrolase